MENTRVLIVRLLTSVLYLTLALLMFSSCKKDKSSNEIAIAEVAAGGNVKLLMTRFSVLQIHMDSQLRIPVRVKSILLV